MDDRSVQYPQRYQLKKVEGTDDIYDLVPAPGTIAKEGTLINKSALLKDETAALFKGLPGNPVPDEVFHILSNAAIVGEDGSLVLPSGEGVSSIKVETGEYTGTGKYGSSNRNSLSFPGDVIILIVCGYGRGANVSMAIVKDTTECFNGVSGTEFHFEGITWDGNSVSWYGGSEGMQANYAGRKYVYSGVILK